MTANVFSQNGYMYNEYLLFLFLIQGRTHCLRFSFLLHVLGSVTNSLQQLLTIHQFVMSAIFKIKKQLRFLHRP